MEKISELCWMEFENRIEIWSCSLCGCRMAVKAESFDGMCPHCGDNGDIIFRCKPNEYSHKDCTPGEIARMRI